MILGDMRNVVLLTVSAFFGIAAGTSFAAEALAEIQVARHGSDPGFKFEKVPAPAIDDAASKAVFKLLDGQQDGNSGSLDVLHDGRVPGNADEPASNFFLKPGPDGGRLWVDLGSVIGIKQIATYSWHAGSRAPQVYRIYGADGKAPSFKPSPGKGEDPLACGWVSVATVDTRQESGVPGGQHGVTVSAGRAPLLGSWRYLIFDLQSTDPKERFAQTFFSELDVIDANAPAPNRIERIVKTFKSADGKFTYEIDANIAPDLMAWSEMELLPAIREWYPKIAALLPSEHYQPPAVVHFQFKDDMKGVPAYAAGDRISLNAPWFRQNLKGEAKGCVVHEMTHVVQNYWIADRVREAKRAPGWVTEGIPDYVRWFLYEPQSRGAEITARNVAQAKYNDSYRISANFLDWVLRTKDKDLIKKLNAAAREGRYLESDWKNWTGSTLEELGAAWKKANEERLAKH
jgi:hypothetical protein